MSKYNSLHNILKDYLEYDERDDTEPYYDVGERTIYVLDILMEVCAQFEIHDIEEMLIEGGFNGAYRVEMDVLKMDGKTIETQVIDAYIIRIPRSSTATGERGTHRG
jgi:hypothetical protein